MDTMHLQIDGMSCGHCVSAVRTALDQLDGVSVDAVSVGSADLRYDATKTGRDAVVTAIADAGYTARAESRHS